LYTQLRTITCPLTQSSRHDFITSSVQVPPPDNECIHQTTTRSPSHCLKRLASPSKSQPHLDKVALTPSPTTPIKTTKHHFHAMPPPISDSTSPNSFNFKPTLVSRVVQHETDACWICHKQGARLVTTPPQIRATMYATFGIFIEVSSRLCKSHVVRTEIKSSQSLTHVKCRVSLVPEQEFKSLITSSSTKSSVDFDDFSIADDDYKRITGVCKEDFSDLLNALKLRDRGGMSPRNSLGMFLMKVRMGCSHKELASLFRVKLKSVHNRIKNLRDMFEKTGGFVDKNLGAASLTRDEIIHNHTTLLAKELFGHDKLILIEDATYIYIQKSYDYAHARKTYCTYKKRYLVKPMVCCTSSGRYVDIFGPYFSNAKNSDAHIFTHQMSVDARKQTESLRNLVQPGDIWVVDRGFQGAQHGATDTTMHMPSFKVKSQKQHSTLNANESRRVTKIRWVVEAANSRLKQFKLLARVISNSQLPQIRSYCRIVAAICNKYRPPLASDQPHHLQMAREMKAKMECNNALKDYCCNGGIYESDAAKNWDKVDNSYVKDFPILTEFEIEQHIAFGCYQIDQAQNYIYEHFSAHGDFQLYKSKVPPKRDDLLHVKFKSRHVEATKYDVYLEMDKSKSTPWQKISAWYCTCASGARTVGCCAHVASVVWWLGIGRLEHDQRKRRTNNWLSIVHAGEDLTAHDIVIPDGQEENGVEIDEDEANEIDEPYEEGGAEAEEVVDDEQTPPQKSRKFTQPETLTVEISEPFRPTPQNAQQPTSEEILPSDDEDVIMTPPSTHVQDFLDLARQAVLHTSTEQFLQCRQLSLSELEHTDTIIALLLNTIESGDHNISLGSINNITLVPASLERLVLADNSLKMWLDSDIVNAYISILSKRSNQDAWLFNSFFHEYVVREHKDDSTRRQWKLFEQANKQIAMVPINEAEGLLSHWSLLIINRARKEISVYGATNNFATSFLVHLKRVDSKKRLRSRDANPTLVEEIACFQLVRNIGFPRIIQKDGFNCGIIMLLHMELISLGISQRLSFSSQDLEQYRLYILLQITKEIGIIS
jgi:hypothetical protein